jgi:hypothetical protein
MGDWVKRHSVNCISCSTLVDERNCQPGLNGEGDICPACLKAATRIRTEDGFVFSRQPDGSWSDGDLTFDSLGDFDLTFEILEKE